MLANVSTVAFVGISTVDVTVQVHLSSGIPAFNIVGMPDKVVAESRERIRAALHSIKTTLPAKRITVNLSPADLLKEGSHYDLPIAIGILAVMGVIKSPERFASYISLGELALDGRITAVSGTLAAVIHARARGMGILCPYENRNEAAFIGDNVNILSPVHLSSLISCLNGSEEEEANTSGNSGKQDLFCTSPNAFPDMKEIIGHSIPKRAIEIAAAGGHNLLMIGPPGTGKSMLAKRLPGILPDLTQEEIIDVNVISSITQRGLNELIVTRPFRELHSSASLASIIGGGKKAVPGEITLAHRGILFLDELPEFSRVILEALRQPLEDKKVVISRVNAHITYPADFQLVAAMNPCKCGYFANINKCCSRAPKCANEYQGRISGPIMSRIELKVAVENVSIFSKRAEISREDSKLIKERVSKARLLQNNRQGINNASLSPEKLGEFITKRMNSGSKKLLNMALQSDNLSHRDLSKILRVSGTISDLIGETTIQEEHVAEAISFNILPT